MPKGRNSGSIEIGQSDQELVGSPKKRDYKKIGGFVGLGVIFIALVIVVVLLVTGNENKTEDEVRHPPIAVALEDFLSGRFSPRRYNATWVSSGSRIMYKDSEGSLVSYDLSTGNINVLLNYTNELTTTGSNFKVSADGRYLLLARDARKLFRHSSLALYDIVDLETLIVTNLNNQTNPFLLVEWGPTGSGLAYVYNNNIYYKENALADAIQITTDGSQTIYNGVCDWVYEEEVFASNVALWFSPDGTKLAYIQFNDALIHLMHIPIYGPPGVIDFQYTQGISIPYPKAGTPNPSVKLFTIDLTGLDTMAAEIPPPTELLTSEPIISAVTWIDNTQILSIWMNRFQNTAIIRSCSNITCHNIITINSDGWLDLFRSPIFNADGTQMAIIMSQQQSVADGSYRHLTIIPTSTTNAPTKALTKGKYVVQDILKWDKDTNFIFYTANTEEHSEIQNIYAIKSDEPDTQIPQCLTCDIIDSNNIMQTYFSADFSTTGNYLALSSDGPSVPRVDIYRWNATVSDAIELTTLAEWETNVEIQDYLNNKSYPQIQYRTYPLPDNFTATVKLLLPTNADLSGTTKYPMLIEVYAGPDSYSGADRWEMGWGSYLAANKSIIYAQINGRGSGLRGDKLLFTIYQKLGTVEIADQISIAKELHKLPFIDASRTAIWGWSYGGYASAMALASSNDTFKCAASVAPVTDWALYDSIYTERYMGTPQNNPVGYNLSRLSTKPEQLKGKEYYLIHGTLDDNVHYQQAMVLARSLERNDVLFKQMSYPDEDHGLYGVRTHLYHSLGHFFAQCFHLDYDL